MSRHLPRRAPGGAPPFDDESVLWGWISQKDEVCAYADGPGRRLPLVGLYRTVIRKKAVDWWLVPPFESEHNGEGFLVASFVEPTKPRLTFVLYDWSLLRLDCTESGLDVDALFDALSRHARDAQGVERWRVSLNEGELTVDTGVGLDVGGKHIVGRVPLGSVPWLTRQPRMANEGLVELIILPRLESQLLASADLNRKVRGAGLVFVGDKDKAKQFADRTISRSQRSKGLLAMLSLASDVAVTEIGSVLCSMHDEPSALAHWPLVHALEQAALAARREYVRESEIMSAPTGTLRVGAWIQEVSRGRPDRVPVDRFRLSIDNDENRLFRGMAARVSMRMSRMRGEFARLVRVRAERALACLAEVGHIDPSLNLVERVSAKSLGAVQRAAVDRCREAMNNRWASLEPGHGNAELSGFELSMAELFEDAVRGALRKALQGAVVDRGGTSTLPPSALQWEDTGNWKDLKRGPTIPSLKPDLHVRLGTRFLLGDVKYKRLQRGSDSPSHQPLRRADLHQIASYMLAWPGATSGLMVYPWVDPLRSPGEGPATLHVTTLWIGGRRPVGIFLFAPERWRESPSDEPLLEWIRNELTVPGGR